MEKRKKGKIIGTIAFALFGLTAIILGFGFGYGWDVFAQFFASPQATPIYIIIPLGIIVAFYIIQWKKTKE